MPDSPARLPAWLPLLPVGLLFAYALNQGLGENNFQDFFIYRAGAAIGLRGESPYDTPKLQARIRAHFEDEGLANNAGFFQPPGGIVLFAPFALLPWPAAAVAWAAANALAAWATLLLLRTFRAPPDAARPERLLELAVAVVYCLNFLTTRTVAVGQTTLLFVACVAVGQWAFERGRPAVGALLWAACFVKPHIALPLLPLAGYLGGWRRLAGLALAVGLLNLAGCLLAGGTPLFLRDYLDFLASAHKKVEFNRVERNPQITSWNRLLLAGTGRLIELTAATTLAGYAVWFGTVVGRVAWSGRPSPAWALAVAAVGALECCQVLGYELLLLALLVPYLRDLYESGFRALPAALLLLIGAQFLSLETFEAIGIGCHRALAVAAAALLLLAGPVAPGRAEQSRSGNEHGERGT